MLVHRFADHPEFAIQLQLASSLISQAQLLYADQQPTAALACFDRLRDIFADHPDPNLQTTVLEGLHSKAMLQRILGEWEAMSATCDELCRLFGDKPEPAMQEAVANVLFWQAGCLRQRRSSLPAAIAVYDVLVQRVTLNRRPVMQMLAARAWQYQAWPMSNWAMPQRQASATPPWSGVFPAATMLSCANASPGVCQASHCPDRAEHAISRTGCA